MTIEPPLRNQIQNQGRLLGVKLASLVGKIAFCDSKMDVVLKFLFCLSPPPRTLVTGTVIDIVTQGRSINYKANMSHNCALKRNNFQFGYQISLHLSSGKSSTFSTHTTLKDRGRCNEKKAFTKKNKKKYKEKIL